MLLRVNRCTLDFYWTLPKKWSVRTSANSNDSMSPVNGNGTHCRGHSETNSLDRGLTLAKTLKAGPFPPPCNKSNSLKRPTETEGEEKERNSAAAGVIMQIITGILTDEIPTETLEPITSGSSSISSPSSHVSKEKKNETETERSSYIDNLNAHCAQEDIVSEFESRMPSTSLSSSIDPITRDVERRMSMKRDGTLNDSICDDGNPDRFSKTRFTVDHAKSLAQNYGAIASGFFRGALQKVKRAGHLGSTTTKGVDEDTTDSEGEQNSEGEQSDGGVPGRNFGRSIVRPRKAKKGPFDFEQLKVEQEINNEHTGAVWCIRFSVCGRLIATAGQDAIIRVWAVRSHIKYFQEMRDRYQQKTDTCGTSSGVFDSTVNDMASFRPPSSSENPPTESLDDTEDYTTLMAEKPFAVFKVTTIFQVTR
ncbi:unnamed protein product [Auanema sp. JU1783]|nr:unnamed protein product [Auanema sp. JU1783]